MIALICVALAIATPTMCDALARYDYALEEALLASLPPPDPPPAEPAPGPAPASGPARRVNSTAYCLTGTMANGRRVFHGAVAMNGVAFGTRWRILDGPLAGRVLTVADRIGHSSQFDVAMPGDCQAARRYGRRTVTIERLP